MGLTVLPYYGIIVWEARLAVESTCEVSASMVVTSTTPVTDGSSPYQKGSPAGIEV